MREKSATFEALEVWGSQYPIWKKYPISLKEIWQISPKFPYQVSHIPLNVYKNILYPFKLLDNIPESLKTLPGPDYHSGSVRTTDHHEAVNIFFIMTHPLNYLFVVIRDMIGVGCSTFPRKSVASRVRNSVWIINKKWKKILAIVGVEPTTFALLARRSNRLS